jgi:hypothetical protein
MGIAGWTPSNKAFVRRKEQSKGRGKGSCLVGSYLTPNRVVREVGIKSNTTLWPALCTVAHIVLSIQVLEPADSLIF